MLFSFLFKTYVTSSPAIAHPQLRRISPLLMWRLGDKRPAPQSGARDVDGQKWVIAPVSGETGDQIGMNLGGCSRLD